MAYEEFKKSIGKDVLLKIADSSKTVKIRWREWLKMDWNYLDVSEEHRTNSLSQSEQRYIVFAARKNEFPTYLCYDNVQNYVTYCAKMAIRGNVPLHGLFNFDIIYVWDKVEENSIVAWEKNGENIEADDQILERVLTKKQYEELARTQIE